MLTAEQHALKKDIACAKTQADEAAVAYWKQRERCKVHVYENRAGEAVCVICGHADGWWCPDSPTHTCEYTPEHGEGCRHCGDPFERL